jgi:3D-(3,5/4)-trihydroxycyclohexane-1,2-dione acylhydrolase (decyclizing)
MQRDLGDARQEAEHRRARQWRVRLHRERLQHSCGGASFNNLFPNGSGIDFAGHAASLGAVARKVASLTELERALPEARAARRTFVIVIPTDPAASTSAGGAWRDVAVPEVSSRTEVALARASYEAARSQQRLTG